MYFTAPRAEDRSPWGDFWFRSIGSITQSGLRMDGTTAMRHSAVFACVRVLSESLMMGRIRAYRLDAKGKKVRVGRHWMLELLRRPNQWQTGSDFRQMIQGHLSLRGNAYALIGWSQAGPPMTLTPLHPDRVSPQQMDNGTIRYQFRAQDGSLQYYTYGDIVHWRGLSSDGLLGMSPLELARETFAEGVAAQAMASRFFTNDGKPVGGYIKTPPGFQFADQNSRIAFRDAWQQAQSGANRGKIAVLEGGLEYASIGVTQDDAQFLETRQYNVKDVARIFRVPPHMIQDLDHATFSNIESQSLEFVTRTMAPIGETFIAWLAHSLMFDDSDMTQFEVDFSELLHGDMNARGAFYASGIQSGWLTRNEARIREDLEEIGGLDEPLIPVNLRGVNEPVPKAQPAPDNLPGTDPRKARLTAMASSAVDRVLRKEAKTGPDAAFVADVLGISIEAAQAYVATRTDESAASLLMRLALGEE